MGFYALLFAFDLFAFDFTYPIAPIHSLPLAGLNMGRPPATIQKRPWFEACKPKAGPLTPAYAANFRVGIR
jgi:hypothetical protein